MDCEQPYLEGEGESLTMSLIFSNCDEVIDIVPCLTHKRISLIPYSTSAMTWPLDENSARAASCN